MTIATDPSLSEEQKIKQAQNALVDWYQNYGRQQLPWRQTRDPYRIYVSEIMLQQTQVITVKERFYDPFLSRFPDLSTLKHANENEVLQYWQGLGYYNRARYLHEVAKCTAPTLPDDKASLIALPGIGENTAHAILSFAYEQPYPVMEANVKRVLSRLHALSNPSEKQLWQYAWQWLNKEHVYIHNQAMMDIGSMVCTRSTPRCHECPLALACLGKTSPESYPDPLLKKRVKAPVREKIIWVIQSPCQQKLWMQKRQTRFLHGLYGFLEYKKSASSAVPPPLALAISDTHLLGSISQSYSHFTLHADCYLAQLKHAHLLPNFDAGEWIDCSQLADTPMSKADEKIVKLVNSLAHKF